MTTSHAPLLLAHPTGARSTAAAGPLVDGWTGPHLDRYVNALTAPGRILLATILACSPCPTDRAREAAGLGECEYAAASVSLEEALFVVPGVVRLPFDVVDGCFTVDGDLARLMLRSIARR